MYVTGTHFNYYQVCRRKLWLFANGISMEHTSDLVYEGKLIHEVSYPQRSEKYEEIEFDGIKEQVLTTKNHVISLQNDRGTQYQKYIEVQNELVAAYNELRNEMAQARFGMLYDELDENRQKAIQTIYPQKISEAEPKNYGGKK